MPTLEESAAAFRAGHEAYAQHPEVPLSMIGCNNDIPGFNLIGSDPYNFADGWKAAQREAEIERHIDEAAVQ